MKIIEKRKIGLFTSTALVKYVGLGALALAVPVHAQTRADMQPVLEAHGTIQARTLPTGGTVVAGAATIASGPGSLTIDQTSQNVVVNWQSFSVGQDGNVTFIQPNSSAVALNRVLGPEASQILGRISSNG